MIDVSRNKNDRSVRNRNFLAAYFSYFDFFSDFFFDFSKTKLKIFRKIRFPIEHKKNYENRFMGFRVTLLLNTKMQVI